MQNKVKFTTGDRGNVHWRAYDTSGNIVAGPGTPRGYASKKEAEAEFLKAVDILVEIRDRMVEKKRWWRVF